jgi:hypothetical protein
MPWITSGYGEPRGYAGAYSSGTTSNQRAAFITIPNNTTITKARVMTSGYEGSATIQLAIWDSTGNYGVLWNSSTINVPAQYTAPDIWRESSLTLNPPNRTVMVGYYRLSGATHAQNSREPGTTNFYQKSNKTGSIIDMSGYTPRSDYRTLFAEVFVIYAPNAPSSVSVSRGSDNSHTISITHTATADRPVNHFVIQRQVDNGTWETVRTQTAKTWTDNGTVAGHSYRWRVYAVNDHGSSGHAYTSTIRTTALAPSNFSVSRGSDTVQNLSWTNHNPSIMYDSIRLERQVDGGSWTLRATLSNTATTFSDTTTSANHAYVYRIRATSTHSSAWTYSSTIYTTPSAPANVLLSQVGNDMVLTWQNTHNHAQNIIVTHKIDDVVITTESIDADSTQYSVAGTAGTHSFEIGTVQGALYSSTVTSNAVRFTLVPEAPSDITVQRLSDTQQNLSWTNNVSAEKPYDSLQVQRWDNVTGNWYTINTVGGTAESYSDTTTQANRKYQYRVRGQNTAGVSGYATSEFIVTTPAAPTNVLGVRSGLDVYLTWKNNCPYADSVTVEISTSGSEFTLLDTLAGDASSYLDAEPGEGVHVYRVTAIAHTLSSAGVLSNEILTLQKPNPPTGLSPSGGEAFTAVEDKTFSWVYNPADATAQTAFEIEYRVPEGNWISTGKITSGTSGYVFAADTFSDGVSYEWRVRTWGQHADVSDWSAVRTFKCSARPVVVITTPVDTHNLPELTLQWLYSDAEGTEQTRYDIVLLKGSTQIHAQNMAGNANTYTIPYTFVDGETYTVNLRVRDSDNMWSAVQSETFTVSYEPPTLPELHITADKINGRNSILIENPAPSGDTPETVSNRLYRVIGDGEPVLIADKIPPNGTVTDYLPLTNGENKYFAVAISSIGSIRQSFEESIDIGAMGWYWLNWGNRYSNVFRMGLNPKLSEGVTRQSAVFTLEGRDDPVVFQGRGVTRVLNLSFILPSDKAAELRDVITEYGGNMVYRDHYGRRFRCMVTNPQISSFRGNYCTLAFAVTKLSSEGVG